jgi:hypothetical protein
MSSSSSSSSNLVSPVSPRKKSVLPISTTKKSNGGETLGGGRVTFDVVIIGSPTVGKASLAATFVRGCASGSDQGIGSDEDSEDCNDRKGNARNDVHYCVYNELCLCKTIRTSKQRKVSNISY